jgi:hypothetical protein
MGERPDSAIRGSLMKEDIQNSGWLMVIGQNRIIEE